MKYQDWPALKPRLQELADEGMNVIQAAKALDTPAVTLYAALNRLGWRDIFPNAKKKFEYKGEVGTISDHARRLGVNAKSAIRRHVKAKKAGGDIDWDWVFLGKKWGLTADQLNALTTTYMIREGAKNTAAMLTYQKIAEKIEVSRSTVQRVASSGICPSSMAAEDFELITALLEERKEAHEILKSTRPEIVAAELGIRVNTARLHLR